jgi:hypothetical protein
LMILGSSVGFLAAAVLARWRSRVWLNRLRTSLAYDPHTRSAPRSELKSAARL